MNKLKTGIKGLDRLMNGGIPKGHSVLISGQTGAGKTVLGLQYLINGAEKEKERGMFLSFEESKDDLIRQGETFGWDIAGLEKKGMIKICEFSPTKEHLKSIEDKISEDVEKFKPDRLVFDSISTYGVYAETLSAFEAMMDLGKTEGNPLISPDSALRRAVMSIMGKIKTFTTTALIISELPEMSNYLSRDTVSEFLSDGVILLKHAPIGDSLNRSMEVRKMRQSAMLEGPRSYNITKKGIIVEV